MMNSKKLWKWSSFADLKFDHVHFHLLIFSWRGSHCGNVSAVRRFWFAGSQAQAPSDAQAHAFAQDHAKNDQPESTQAIANVKKAPDALVVTHDPGQELHNPGSAHHREKFQVHKKSAKLSQY